MPYNTVILHLSLLEDIGPTTIHALADNLGTDLHNIYSLLPSDLIERCGISRKKAAAIVNGLQDTTLLDQELALIEKYGVSWCTIFDDQYPALLKTIEAPPAILYWFGSAISDDQKRLAIIGSRQANYYGQRVIDQLVPPLINRDWVIVSGGAIGADSMAHQATLDAGGKTIVVLGSGLLHWYPAGNERLFNAVINNGGTILSIFPLRMQGLAGNFPARNRIISGLSKGCVVVQAAQRSGASITAHLALEQGRDVFAVPGSIDCPLSAGCHALIQEGAKLIRSVDDILVEYGEVVIKQEKRVTQVAPALALTPDQQKVYDLCQQPTTVDDLLESTGLSFEQLNTLFFDLQIAGLVEQTHAGQWQRVR